MADGPQCSYDEIAVECIAKSKDLYKIMPLDNGFRRRIVEASNVLAKASAAIRELEHELAVLRSGGSNA